MIRINRFSNPALGGRTVEFLTSERKTTVVHPGYTAETHSQNWMHAGVLMDPVRNHVPEQPTNKWKQRLIDAQRGEQA